jgi:hypothetical protein
VAFRHVKLGTALVARSDGEYVIVENTTGGVEKYKAPLGVVTQNQLHDFESDLVNFYLEHDGVCYVGRKDGTFSGYKLEDNLLTRFGKWEAPLERDLALVGSYCNTYKVAWSAYIDLTDLRTIYMARNKDIYVLNDRYRKSVNIRPSLVSSWKGEEGLHLFTEEGRIDLDENGHWFVPSVPRSRNNKVRL